MSTYQGTYRLLLIEDNPADAGLVEILMQESDLAGFALVKCQSLLEGLHALSENEHFAAILLDLSLPDSTGFDTLEKLLSLHPNQNIIVMTGLDDKTLGLKAVQAGSQDYLVKGAFDASQLSKSLRFSIERSAIRSRLEETQRIAHIGHWECTPETDFFSASDEVYRIFGLAPRKTEVSCHDLHKPENPFHLLYKVQREAQRLTTIKKDLPLRLPDSSFRFVFVQCHAESRGEGYTFHGIIQDITERKLAEHEMAKSRERYQEIFSQSNDAIYIATLHGKLIDCNPAMERLFQKGNLELLSLDDMHSMYHPQERRNEFLLRLKFQKSVRDFELSIERTNGERRTVLISANLQDDDEFGGYNAIIRDVTEKKETEELIKSRDLAQQSAQLKEQFIASISHEMRTPMNAIFGMSNLLSQTALSQEQTELVDSINQSSEILLGIINDILEIAVIQNGKIVFTNEPFNLKDLLGNLTNVMQFKAKEKDLFLQIDLESDVPCDLVGDKLRLNQILYNLVGNAIKFTDEGFVKVVVEKLNDFEGGVHLKFMVEDTGIGIPADQIDSVFESFTRIKQKDRLYEGTGLGLSIGKSLVEQQGGKIWLASELGQGSRFYFDLIFETGSAAAQIIRAEVQEIPEDAIFHLLLVEDHKLNQMVAKKTLEKKWKNIRISVAENGKEAIDMLEHKPCDIVLMDVQMPVMDGYEATRIIREQLPPPVNQLPVLAMTAHAHLSKDEKFREYGMDDYVLKPFQPEELFTKISKYLKTNLIPT